MTLNVVILAAGKGTRMRSALPKVLQPLASRPLLAHVIDNALPLNPARIIVVYGHGGQQVRTEIDAIFPSLGLEWVEQAEQRGTGHATAQALPVLEPQARTLILYGDVPLTSTDTLRRMLQEVPADTLGLITVSLPTPTGYGRIVRDASGKVCSIVEEKDATAEQKAIDEVNTGIMLAPSERLAEWLPRLRTSNAQGEYYLTDIVAMAASDVGVQAVMIADAAEAEGVNDKLQLARLERLYQRRIAHRLMRDGVTVMDPERLDVRGDLRTGMDCSLDINVVVEGTVVLGNRVRIGPHCVLTNCVIGDDCEIKANSVIEGAELSNGCDVGPFARLRPGTVLESGAKIGNFVETKNARLGEDSKASHLTYLGDCDIGRDVNVGAGTITCNYDGANKHKTVIGDGAFIGSNASLVAPIEIGAGATIGAGSTVTRKADAGVLTVTRAKQITVTGWQRPVKKKH